MLFLNFTRIFSLFKFQFQGVANISWFIKTNKTSFLSYYKKRLFIRLSSKFDKITQTIITVMRDTVSNVIKNIPLHRPRLSAKMFHKFFLGKAPIINIAPSLLPKFIRFY